MIGYRITLPDLEARIDALDPSWRRRAKVRTTKLVKLGKYDEGTAIWTEVKTVYFGLQGDSKCAFCERKLESEKYGKGEQAIEHFRPKGAIVVWAVPADLTAAGLASTPSPAAGGYHELAYHPFNYTAACIPCNSALKKNFFPIAGTYTLTGSHPSALLALERPFLIYPIGDFDVDPEHLIEFYGVLPRPSQTGHERLRAQATIAVFELNDVESRANLVRERAAGLVALFPQLEILANPGKAADHDLAQQVVDSWTSPKSPHTNCNRSFQRLFEADPAEARKFFEAAVALVKSKS